MKYKNITKTKLDFRAFNPKGEKVVFSVEPDEVIEVKSKISWYGLQLVKEKNPTTEVK